MSRAHDKLVNDILLAVGQRDDMTVWRNFVGTVRAYSQPKKVFKVGLDGSADIFGIMGASLNSSGGKEALLQAVSKIGTDAPARIIDCPPRGVFLAIEAKVATKQHTEQEWFEKMITSRGGLYLVAYSVEEAIRGIDEWWTARR